MSTSKFSTISPKLDILFALHKVAEGSKSVTAALLSTDGKADTEKLPRMFYEEAQQILKAGVSEESKSTALAFVNAGEAAESIDFKRMNQLISDLLEETSKLEALGVKLHAELNLTSQEETLDQSLPEGIKSLWDKSNPKDLVSEIDLEFINLDSSGDGFAVAELSTGSGKQWLRFEVAKNKVVSYQEVSEDLAASLDNGEVQTEDDKEFAFIKSVLLEGSEDSEDLGDEELGEDEEDSDEDAEELAEEEDFDEEELAEDADEDSDEELTEEEDSDELGEDSDDELSEDEEDSDEDAEELAEDSDDEDAEESDELAEDEEDSGEEDFEEYDEDDESEDEE